MRLSILISLLLSLVPAQAAETDFLIYQVKHRPAQELVDVASGVFRGRATFSSLNEKIVVNVPPTSATARAVLQLFAELDHRPRRFCISLRRRGEESTERTAVAGKIKKGASALEISAGDSRGQGSAKSSVIVSEGERATVGQSPDTFLVKIVSVSKGEVSVDVQAEANAQVLSTNASLPLAQWTEIGRTNQQSEQSQREILAKSSARENKLSEFQLRVDELR